MWDLSRRQFAQFALVLSSGAMTADLARADPNGATHEDFLKVLAKWRNANKDRIYWAAHEQGGWEAWLQVEIAMALREAKLDYAREQTKFKNGETIYTRNDFNTKPDFIINYNMDTWNEHAFVVELKTARITSGDLKAEMNDDARGIPFRRYRPSNKPADLLVGLQVGYRDRNDKTQAEMGLQKDHYVLFEPYDLRSASGNSNNSKGASSSVSMDVSSDKSNVGTADLTRDVYIWFKKV